MDCPNCGGNRLKKNGFLPSGKQRYFCKDCKKYFSSFEIIKKDPPKECIYCKGTNTVKSGRGANNKQIWLCKDCNRKFIDGIRNVSQIKQRCPYCDGELTVKGWSNAGTVRRYKCKSCGKGFSGDLNNLKVKTIDMPCPYCGSENIKKGGLLKSGIKRYKCNDCGKGFNANTVAPTEPEYRPEKCPKCGATHINKCGRDTKTKKQRYKCVTCGYKFVENPTQNNLQRATKYEIQCPRCNNPYSVKAGKTGDRKQYYKCTECNHKFLPDSVYKHITPKQKALIVTQSIKGQTAITIAEQFNTTERTVRNVLQQYYEKERLTPQQEQLLYKFGVECAVPIDYLFPYVGCTKHACKQYLSQYIIPKREPKPISEQQRAFDKLELDRFMR